MQIAVPRPTRVVKRGAETLANEHSNALFMPRKIESVEHAMLRKESQYQISRAVVERKQFKAFIKADLFRIKTL